MQLHTWRSLKTDLMRTPVASRQLAAWQQSGGQPSKQTRRREKKINKSALKWDLCFWQLGTKICIQWFFFSLFLHLHEANFTTCMRVWEIIGGGAEDHFLPAVVTLFSLKVQTVALPSRVTVKTDFSTHISCKCETQTSYTSSSMLHFHFFPLETPQTVPPCTSELTFCVFRPNNTLISHHFPSLCRKKYHLMVISLFSCQRSVKHGETVPKTVEINKAMHKKPQMWMRVRRGVIPCRITGDVPHPAGVRTAGSSAARRWWRTEEPLRNKRSHHSDIQADRRTHTSLPSAATMHQNVWFLNVIDPFLSARVSSVLSTLTHQSNFIFWGCLCYSRNDQFLIF